MKRIIASILSALLVIAAPVVEAIDLDRLFSSVRSITDSLNNRGCSSSSINEVKHYWLTAAHCLGQEERYVDGEMISVVMRDVINDLAVFSTPTSHAPALELAGKAPKVGDEVLMVGFPYGILDPIMTFGKVSQTNGLLCRADEETSPHFCEPRRYFVVDALGAPGSSGAPVLNKNGQMVSVQQVGFNQSYGTSWGVPYEVLRKIVRSYFERGPKK